MNFIESQKPLSCRRWLQLASVAEASLSPLSVVTLLKLITTEKTSGKMLSRSSSRMAGTTNGQPFLWAGDPAAGATPLPSRGLVTELSV